MHTFSTHSHVKMFQLYGYHSPVDDFSAPDDLCAPSDHDPLVFQELRELRSAASGEAFYELQKEHVTITTLTLDTQFICTTR